MTVVTEAENLAEGATGAGWLKLLLPLAGVLALIGAIWAIYHRGERAGGDKVSVASQQQHTAAVVQARADERGATAAAAATGAQAMAATDAAIAALQLEEKRIHDALDAVPPARPGAALPAAPAGVLAASVNDGIARANRAADAADAAAGAGQDAAP